MKTIILKSGIGFIVLAMIMVFSCQKEEPAITGSDQEEEATLESVSVGESETDDVLQLADLAEFDLAGNTGGRIAKHFCGTVTRDTVNHQIIIDFGDGCTGPHGRIKSGKIIITYSFEVGDSIPNRIITFENFFINRRGITGTIELRDIAVNDEGNLECTKRLIDLTITFPNGERLTLNGSRTREWIAGAGDNDPTNNIFQLTGSLSGISTKGRSFTSEITEPVIVDWSCAEAGNLARVSGQIGITRLGNFGVRKRIIDYGDGECDNIITIITEKRQYTITVN